MNHLVAIMFVMSFIVSMTTVFIGGWDNKEPVARAIFRSTLALMTTIIFAALIIREGF